MFQDLSRTLKRLEKLKRCACGETRGLSKHGLDWQCKACLRKEGKRVQALTAAKRERHHHHQTSRPTAPSSPAT